MVNISRTKRAFKVSLVLLVFAIPLKGNNTLKVGSHGPVSIQLTLKIFVFVIEFVGVHTIQFLHPIIS